MKKTNLSAYDPSLVPGGKPFKIAVVAAEWNAEITNALLEGAIQTLATHGVEAANIIVRHVPGTFELTGAANMLLDGDSTIDAVICIGCVIQGETRHFDYICQAVAQGVSNVSIKHSKPVIFSVLTCDTIQQALDRAGGKHGNKGVEGAVTALKMCQFHRECE